MKNVRIIFLAVSMVLALTSAASAKEVDYTKILSEVDRISNFENMDFKATVTIVSEEAEKEKSVLKSTFFRRDKDKKFLVLINDPETQRGEGYLKEGDNLWFYDPNTRNFSHTSLSERFAGSSANNDDFGASSLAKDYTVIEAKDGKVGVNPVYILKLKAKNDKVTYPFLKIWVTKDKKLVLMQEEYSLEDRVVRTSVYTEHTKVKDRWIPLNQLFIDNIVKGNRSQMTIEDVNVGKIPDSTFTQAYVEKVNK